MRRRRWQPDAGRRQARELRSAPGALTAVAAARSQPQRSASRADRSAGTGRTHRRAGEPVRALRRRPTRRARRRRLSSGAPGDCGARRPPPRRGSAAIPVCPGRRRSLAGRRCTPRRCELPAIVGLCRRSRCAEPDGCSSVSHGGATATSPRWRAAARPRAGHRARELRLLWCSEHDGWRAVTAGQLRALGKAALMLGCPSWCKVEGAQAAEDGVLRLQDEVRPLPAADAQGGHAARRVYGQEAQAGPVDGKKVTKKRLAKAA